VPTGTLAVAGDFGSEESVLVIQEIFKRDEAIQGWEMVDSVISAAAGLLTIATFLCLKTNMSLKRSSDETELVMMCCLILGFLLPFLDALLAAGPRSVVGWIGSMAQTPADDTMLNVCTRSKRWPVLMRS